MSFTIKYNVTDWKKIINNSYHMITEFEHRQIWLNELSHSLRLIHCLFVYCLVCACVCLRCRQLVKTKMPRWFKIYRSSLGSSQNKWMLTVNWIWAQSRNSWQRLSRVAAQEWLITVFVCVFMIIIHVELLWYNQASWGASSVLNLCCPSSFIKHT